jgi:hypothetical protein
MALMTSTSLAPVQTSTQSPQAATMSNFGASQSSGGVQPGTAATLLNSSQGIKLADTALPAINLGTSTAATSSASPSKNSNQHHINGPLLGFAGLLIVVALVLFWTASHSIKNTT